MGTKPNNWHDVNKALPNIDEQVWVRFVYPSGEVGYGYAIYVGEDDAFENDWFWDVTEDGDLQSRSAALKDKTCECATITHWHYLPEEIC